MVNEEQPSQFGHLSFMDAPYQQLGYQLTEISTTWQILHGFL
jgi:hypothetical protein